MQRDPATAITPPAGAPTAQHVPGATRSVSCAGLRIGPGSCTLIAGPCAVESREQLMATARGVAAAGGVILRGGAFKPRTSPRSFQGLGHAGLDLLAEAREATGLPVVTELLDPADAAGVASAADMIQIGARSMHAAPVLDAAARTGLPVLLKRSPGATVSEWLAAAEYIFAAGNDQVILCERGIRTFEDSTRFTLDLGGMVAARRQTDLPIIVDPSHAAGDAQLVAPLAAAAIAAGADGIMIETHPDPAAALSDGRQSLQLSELEDLVEYLSPIVTAAGREWQGAPAGALA